MHGETVNTKGHLRGHFVLFLFVCFYLPACVLQRERRHGLQRVRGGEALEGDEGGEP